MGQWGGDPAAGHFLKPATTGFGRVIRHARDAPLHARRQDNVAERLTYFEIRVGNTPASWDPTANAQCAMYDSPQQSIFTLTCTTPLSGRYLVVRLRPEYSAFRPGDFLTLCEVTAFGLVQFPPPPLPPRQASRRTACAADTCYARTAEQSDLHTKSTCMQPPSPASSPTKPLATKSSAAQPGTT